MRDSDRERNTGFVYPSILPYFLPLYKTQTPMPPGRSQTKTCPTLDLPKNIPKQHLNPPSTHRTASPSGQKPLSPVFLHYSKEISKLTASLPTSNLASDQLGGPNRPTALLEHAIGSFGMPRKLVSNSSFPFVS